MLIRPLTEHDAAAFRALRLRALRDDPDPFMSTYDEEQAWPLDRTAERLRANAGTPVDAVLGAFDGDPLVGTLGLFQETKRKARHRAVLWGMYVAPEARGRGVGRALLDAAIERIQTAPEIEQVHLAAVTTSDAARRLYRRAGFVIVGMLPRALKDGDRYLDEELMLLELPRAPSAGAPAVLSPA